MKNGGDLSLCPTYGSSVVVALALTWAVDFSSELSLMTTETAAWFWEPSALSAGSMVLTILLTSDLS